MQTGWKLSVHFHLWFTSSLAWSPVFSCFRQEWTEILKKQDYGLFCTLTRVNEYRRKHLKKWWLHVLLTTVKWFICVTILFWQQLLRVQRGDDMETCVCFWVSFWVSYGFQVIFFILKTFSASLPGPIWKHCFYICRLVLYDMCYTKHANKALVFNIIWIVKGLSISTLCQVNFLQLILPLAAVFHCAFCWKITEEEQLNQFLKVKLY